MENLMISGTSYDLDDVFNKMSDDPKLWKVDKFNLHRLGSKNANLFCELCKSHKHKRRNCYKLKYKCRLCGSFKHRTFQCPEIRCSICFRSDHESYKCPQQLNRCEICSCFGHVSKHCTMNWKRFLTVTDADVYNQHIDCDVTTDECDVCSFSRWKYTEPKINQFDSSNNYFYNNFNNQQMPYGFDNPQMPCGFDNPQMPYGFYNSEMQHDFEEATNCKRIGIKRKPNSNLRPSNPYKKLKKSKATKYSEMEEVNWCNAFSDTNSDYDNYYWTIRHLQRFNNDFGIEEPYLFSTPSVDNEVQFLNEPFDNRITPSTSYQNESKEEDSFLELIRDSTCFNPEPFQGKKSNKIKKKNLNKNLNNQNSKTKNQSQVQNLKSKNGNKLQKIIQKRMQKKKNKVQQTILKKEKQNVIQNIKQNKSPKKNKNKQNNGQNSNQNITQNQKQNKALNSNKTKPKNPNKRKNKNKKNMNKNRNKNQNQNKNKN